MKTILAILAISFAVGASGKDKDKNDPFRTIFGKTRVNFSSGETIFLPYPESEMAKHPNLIGHRPDWHIYYLNRPITHLQLKALVKRMRRYLFAPYGSVDTWVQQLAPNARFSRKDIETTNLGTSAWLICKPIKRIYQKTAPCVSKKFFIPADYMSEIYLYENKKRVLLGQYHVFSYLKMRIGKTTIIPASITATIIVRGKSRLVFQRLHYLSEAKCIEILQDNPRFQVLSSGELYYTNKAKTKIINFNGCATTMK